MTSGCLRREFTAWYAPSDAPNVEMGIPGRLAAIPDEGNDLGSDVGVVLRLNVAAMKRMRALVVETFSADLADREEFHPPAVDELAKRLDDALIFVFPFVAAAGRK